MGLKVPKGLCKVCLQPTGSDRARYCDAHRPSKYRNTKTKVGDLVFDSKKEARRWQELMLLQENGAITDLRRQVRFPLVVNGEKVCAYVADACYRIDGELVVEDVKSEITRRKDTYRIKRKLMKAVHGIDIREV